MGLSAGNISQNDIISVKTVKREMIGKDSCGVVQELVIDSRLSRRKCRYPIESVDTGDGQCPRQYQNRD